MYEYRKMTPEEQLAVLAERKANGYPLHSPPHFKGIPGAYLITAACYEHRRVFDTPDLLSLLADELLASLSKANLPYHAWIFLPNHYHLLLEMPDLALVSNPLRKAHSRIATKANIIQGKPGRRVWYRYSDRLIRDERHYWTTVNYIHYNPIKHGYVELMSEWPWSSIHVFGDTIGVEELQRVWRAYPIKDYGKGWDD
jgi:putative transposase